MAFENLFLRTKKSIGGIQLDAVLRESHSNRVTLSNNPLELGADIVDHARVEPKELSLIAVVSDTPLGGAAIGEIVDTVTGKFGSSNEPNITRSNAAYNSLLDLQRSLEPIDVQTKLVLYENMVIVDIRVSQEADTSRSIELFIDLKEAIIVESEIVILTEEQLSNSLKKIASSPDKKGRKAPITPSETTRTSALKTISNWVSQ